MKKLLLLFAVMLSAVGAWAQLVVTSTEDSPIYYVISSYDRGGVITYANVGDAIQHTDYNANSLWYFETVPDNENNGVYIVNKSKSGEDKVYLGSDKKASTTAAVWYVLENGVNNFGYSISSSTSVSTNYSCLDAQDNAGIGGWQPAAGDWQGTTWVFHKETDLLDPTYNPNGWVTRAGTGGRYIKSITINGVQQTTTPYYGLVYFDLTESATFNVAAGSEVEISIDRNGGWMQAFAYVDFDGNGFTTDGVDTDGYTPTGDLVTYSCYDADDNEAGVNSAGTELTEAARNTVAMPSFTAPENPGVYRLRVKYDWNDLDPNGTDGKINSAGGVFVDVTLNVVSVDVMATVTYIFKYGNEEKGREVIEVTKGSEYPDYTRTFPYGIVATAKPTGTVEADAEVEIALTNNLPFTVSTLTDGEFGGDMAWYYLKMRSKDVTYDATTGMALAQNVDEKSAYNYFAFTGNPFDGFSIYNYVAGSNKVFWRADATNGGRVFFTDKEDTDGNTWVLSANGTSGYVFRLNGYETGYMNDHQPEIAIWNSSWGATDGGSTFTFEYVENPDLTILYDITYEYVYDGDVKATQTFTVEEGSEYPACSYVAPYGVIVGAKPEGSVSADGTHQIELTKEKEFTSVKTVVDAANIDTWYYVQMHANGNVTSYIEDNGGSTVEWTDKTVAQADIESHLWGFVGDVFGMKMVNKKTGKAIASTGSGSASMSDVNSATSFVVTASQANDPWFCFKYPTNNNYLNAQGDCIKHWAANDNGSSFKATEYKIHEVEVGTADYATLYLGSKVFIPETVEAYVVSEATGNYASLTQVTGSLPANTGVILKGEGTHQFITSADAATTIESNLLAGSVENTYVAGPAYVLANGTNGVGLYKATLNKDAEGAVGTTHFLNNANKAYLPAATGAESRFLVFNFGGTETAIEGIEAESTANAVVYDLAGRRVQKAQKGRYIVNGKKVIK